MSRARAANYIALPILLAAAVFGVYWIWGLLFVWWIFPIIVNGQSFLLFEVKRAEDPVLYWAVVGLWAVLGLLMIAASLFPQYTHLLV